MPELTSPHPIGEHAPQQSDLPAPPRAHALTLENRARLTVTGVTRIVSCDELGATLQTPLGDLTIGGQGMQVSELSVRTGEVHISGQIEYLQYTENQQSKKTERWAAGPPAALMVPSPPLWAVLGDVLLCLGAGLLLGAVRDGATLPLAAARCAALCGMCWPLLPQPLSAAASRRGLRLPGRRAGIWPPPWGWGHCAGGGAFPTRCTGAARHGACSGLAAALCGGLCGTPVQTVAAGPGSERFGTPGGATHKIHARKAEKKAEKCVAKQAHNII